MPLQRSCVGYLIYQVLQISCLFFFQAEDGIRDFHVTGVQTCALPIYNRDFSGSPVWTGTTGAINFTWGSGPPVLDGVTTTGLTDNFSVRFTTGAFFTAGTYRFTVTVDDGARLYVDGALLINDWREAAQRTLQAEHTFATDGTHTIIVEMFDAQYD